MALTLIAETGARFAGFGPFVASINDRGRVAFAASLRAGGTGVFAGDGGPIETIVDPGCGLAITSHPDIDDAKVSFYARTEKGEGVFIADQSDPEQIAGPPELASVGPLGPTMSATAIAFRATLPSGLAGVFATDLSSRATTTIALAGPGRDLIGLDGLPVINRAGAIVFCASREGGHVIHLHQHGSLEEVVATGDRFDELGRFPTVTDSGVVAFTAILAGGLGAGAFVVDDGELECVVEAGRFASVRGVLISERDVVFYATPHDGAIGVYRTTFTDESARIVSVGDLQDGSTVSALVLNPVSLNSTGQVALRIELEDGREQILRDG